MSPPALGRLLGIPLLLASTVLFRPLPAYAPELPLQALAPYEVVLEGLTTPRYLVIDPQDRLFLSEAEPGRLLQLSPDHTVTVLLDQLVDPEGLAVDPSGALFVAAERQKGTEGKGQNGVILRRDLASQALSVVAGGFQHPKGLALDGSGHLVLSAEGQQGDTQAKGALYTLDVAGRIVRLLEGVTKPQGVLVAPDGGVYVAGEQFDQGRATIQGSLFRVDSAGQATLVSARRLRDPFGVARDLLQGLFVSGTQPAGPTPELGMILKRRPDGQEVVFAQGLHEPRGLALDRHGHLYVVDAQQKRVLKFIAPAAPSLDPSPPAVTNSATVRLRGTTEPGALLTVQGAAVPGTGVADAAGHFALDAPLAPNAATTLQLFTTAAGGDGLTSPPIEVTVLHDAIPPSVRLASPADGATLSGAFAVEVEALDALSGVEGVSLLVDGRSLAVTNVAPYRFPLDARDFTGGRHTLTVRVTDRAGNLTSTSITFLVATLRLAITTPEEGASVRAGSLLVRGTVEAAGAEVGVVVNGIPAALQGTAFATLVPVMPDTTTLTAVATAATGMTATHRVAITAASSAERTLILHASPPSGVTPLSVAFSLLGAPAGTVQLDADGDGSVDFAGPTLERHTFTYAQPGLYFPTVSVTDASGNRITITGLVQVSATASLDALLQARWTALKEALRQGNIAQAMQQIFGRTRPRYEAIFRALVSDLAVVDTILTDIQLLEVRRAEAIYEMVRTDSGVARSFEIRFRLDDDGIWRLWMF